MKRTIHLLALVLFLSHLSMGQTSKIKVVLIGTFHFGATSDANSTKFPDLFSKNRQLQLDTIAQKVALLQPDKVFVENEPSKNSKLDSLFEIYKAKGLADTIKYRSETYQLGFRMAKMAHLKKVYAVDYPMALPFSELREAQQSIGSLPEDSLKIIIQNFPTFFQQAKPYDENKFPKLSTSTLQDYYIFINSKPYRYHLMYDYLQQPMTFKYFSKSVGIKYTSIWYERNLNIFNNILLHLSKQDKLIVILFGGAHTAVLRQYFDNHPLFEIVELEKVIR
jgi:hypothetical protein